MKQRITRVVVLNKSKAIAEVLKDGDVIVAKLENGKFVSPEKPEKAVDFRPAKDHERAKFYKAAMEEMCDEVNSLYAALSYRRNMEEYGRKLAEDLKQTSGLLGYRFVSKDKVKEVIDHLEYSFD